jgi:hypothetical protein
MKAVILVLLLVAGTLVHSAPQEAQEGGKSMYKYRNRSCSFINALIEGGCLLFVRDIIIHAQPRKVTQTWLFHKYARNTIDITTEIKFYLGEISMWVDYILHKYLNSNPYSYFCPKENIHD